MLAFAPSAQYEQRRHELKLRRSDVRKALHLRPVKWLCPNTGDSLSYPIDEPMNKPCYCNSCGKIHLFQPGPLDSDDVRIIDELRIIADVEAAIEMEEALA